MSDTSTNLGLPYLLAAQAQKHVTHNEALRLLDAMVQLSVLDRIRTTPPASPADGDRYLVASGATGLWAGWDLNVAFWVDGVWMRLVPRPGWLVWVAAEQVFLVWNGTVWDPVGVPQDVSDAIFSLANDADPTKKALFSLSGLAIAPAARQGHQMCGAEEDIEPVIMQPHPQAVADQPRRHGVEDPPQNEAAR